MTNIEKAKFLRECRKKMGLTQADMAQRLGLDATYLSQLENDRRPIDDFYIDKVKDIQSRRGDAGDHGGGYVLNDRGPDPIGVGKKKCLNHMRDYLSGCNDANEVAWTLVELRHHFPLKGWQDQISHDAKFETREPMAGEDKAVSDAARGSADAALDLAKADKGLINRKNTRKGKT